MLSEEVKQSIGKAVKQSETTRVALPEVLQIVQRQNGWISDEQIDEISAFIGMSPAEIDEIATFYSMIFRRPVGRHVILLCTSVSCWIMGVNPLYEQLKERLGIVFGETTADWRFTLLPSVCLGACDHAPAMMIGDDLHWDVDVGRLDGILESYL